MIRSIIVAVASNRAIGKNNRLIWRLPDDMKFFVKKTMGHHVIMGRKNYDSIPPAFRPFKGRPNIILTRDEQYDAPGCTKFDTIESSLDYCVEQNEDEAFIIGGGQIYKDCLDLNLVDKMYITEINQAFEGDVLFPEFDKDKWQEVERIHHGMDDKHPHSFDYVTYIKKN